MSGRNFEVEFNKIRSFIQTKMKRSIKINFPFRVLMIVIGAVRTGYWMRVSNNNTICINMGMLILY